MEDPFDLNRFVEAQERRYQNVVHELQRGRKTGHWIWYIFPQVEGLGFSATSRRYSISSMEEARAYLDHPVLGPRLLECAQLVMDVEGRSAEQIFGHPDCLKFRSCMTLFAHADPDARIFRDALEKYYDGAADPLTIERLESDAASPQSSSSSALL